MPNCRHIACIFHTHKHRAFCAKHRKGHNVASLKRQALEVSSETSTSLQTAFAKHLYRWKKLMWHASVFDWAQLKGHSVCVVERRTCEGRAQEWNSSRQELRVLSDLGLLTPAQVPTLICCIVHGIEALQVFLRKGPAERSLCRVVSLQQPC